jgi:CMP-N,N'-diacetyllegionaminic acid synthase
MDETVAVIPARGGSKGIPKKNLVDICGKPLLVWSIEHAIAARNVGSVWVSSDDSEILEVASKNGARIIRRPDAISGDTATSESAWLHALDEIELSGTKVDYMVALQATSPVRSNDDIDNAINVLKSGNYDSVFASAMATDFNFWRRNSEGKLHSANYDYKYRGRRQDRADQYLENGSIYVFKPNVLRQHNNRLGGKIGTYIMPMWRSFQIDELEDIELCSMLVDRLESNR